MTNEKDPSRTAKDVPTVEVTVRYLKALRQAVGLHIDPETAEVDCIYAQTLDPMATFPISRRNTNKSGENTSPALLEVTCGSRFATSPKPRHPRGACGMTSERV
jgi:hypothetical protein